MDLLFLGQNDGNEGSFSVFADKRLVVVVHQGRLTGKSSAWPLGNIPWIPRLLVLSWGYLIPLPDAGHRLTFRHPFNDLKFRRKSQ